MSFNRENVIWQAENGTWGRGFYEAIETGPDPEWDVEYTNRFEWAVTGLASEHAAEQAWHGPNPGGWSRFPWAEENRSRIEKWEKMAKEARC